MADSLLDSKGRALKRCSWCGAPVRWVTMAASGRKNPLDPEPRADGNVVLEAHNDAWAKALRRGEDHEGERYQSHWVSCPEAWRRRGVSKPARTAP